MLSSNLQFLRRKTGYSQQELADLLEIPRTTWSGYELGKVEPNINMLQKISIFFHQSIDRLLNQRIDFDELEIARADTLRVLAITMDQDQRQPTGSYRAFEIHGDSMLPMPSGSLVISKYVESLKDLKDDKTYIIVTEKDGIVYKRIKNHIAEHHITAISDNDVYSPYTISYQDIREIWRYHAHIVFSDARQQKYAAQTFADGKENVEKGSSQEPFSLHLYQPFAIRVVDMHYSNSEYFCRPPLSATP